MIVAILMTLAAASYMFYVDHKDQVNDLARSREAQQEKMQHIIQSDGQPIAPMTGEQCQQAALESGWSGTWAESTDGCWLVSPDGTQIEHVGTWKGD
jgi:hypothetical protein